MAPKKKSKASKFARMTDEERARYLQHRAAVEEEARRRKQELVFTFLKSKFKREDAFARINLAKIHQQWRQILRNIKIVELKNEVEALQISFQRVFDSKDNAIKSLVTGLEEAEVQYRRNLHSHICTADRLIALQGERLSYLHESYLAKKNKLLENRKKRLEELAASNSMSQEQMLVIIHASETKYLKSETEAKSEYVTKTTEWKNTVDNEQNLMMGSRESTIERLCKTYQDITNEYFTSTEERRKHYAVLKTKDDLNCAIIKNQAKRLEDGEVLIEKLKNQLASLQNAYDLTISNFKDERQEFSAHFHRLRNHSQLMEKLDNEKIKHLTICSNKTIQHLEKLIEKAENILRLSQSCRRFETLQEKVVKPKSIEIKPTLPQIPGVEPKKDDEDDTSSWLKKSLADYKELDGFWKRFNKVLMERATLKLHFTALSLENEQLKAALRHYLCSIAPSSCMIGEGGDRRHSATETRTGLGMKSNLIEATSKKIIPREKYYRNLPRPITAIEGCFAARKIQP